jgi:2-C-methyl-D-erythritol 4-phosphate cytidylyltransferase
MPVYLCEGSRENIKLTTLFDLGLAETILNRRDEEANA